jgi:hypothetical protein
VYFGAVARWLKGDWMKFLNLYRNKPDTWIVIIGSYSRMARNEIPESQRIPGLKLPPEPHDEYHLGPENIFNDNGKDWTKETMDTVFALVNQLIASDEYDTITVFVKCDALMRDALKKWKAAHPEYKVLYGDSYFEITSGHDHS